MREPTSRLRISAAVVAACLTIEVFILAWPDKTEHDGWIRRDRSGEIAGETVVAQSLHVVGPNFRAIRFYAQPYGSQVAGMVHLRLVEIRGDDMLLINELRVPTTDVVSASQYKYDFPPIPWSANRDYELTIALPDAEGGRGITVGIMRRAYNDTPTNALSFAGRHRFGSLRYSADVDRTTLLGRSVAHLHKGTFGSLKVAAFAVAWVVLHLLAAGAVAGTGALGG